MSLNLLVFLIDVNNNGVDATKYSKFVDYIVASGSEISEPIADTYDGIVTTTYRNLYLFLATFVLLASIVILLFFYFLGYISLALCLAGLVIILVIFVLFYAVLDSFARESNFVAAQRFGTSTSESIALSITSLFRDSMYLALLR